LNKVAEEASDPQLCDLIASVFLKEQVDSIKEICDMLTQVTRVGGDGVGLYLWGKFGLLLYLFF